MTTDLTRAARGDYFVSDGLGVAIGMWGVVINLWGVVISV